MLLRSAPIALALVLVTAGASFADSMTLEYAGTINTFGFSSSPFFQDRPETTIRGTIVYESDTVGETSPLPLFRFDAITSFSFVIDLPDIADYVSTSLLIGSMDLTTNLDPRVDLLVQGVFDGPDFGLSSPVGFLLRLQDGVNHPTNPLFDQPAQTLTETALPVGPLDLDDFNGGSVMVEWQNSLGGFLRAHFPLTSMTITATAEAQPVPEPATALLLAAGSIVVAFAKRVRRRRGDRTRLRGDANTRPAV